MRGQEEVLGRQVETYIWSPGKACSSESYCEHERDLQGACEQEKNRAQGSIQRQHLGDKQDTRHIGRNPGQEPEPWVLAMALPMIMV